MATKNQPSQKEQTEQFDEIVSASEKILEGWIARIARRFSLGSRCLEFLEPGISGIALAFVLWGIDAVRIRLGGAPLFEDFVTSSVHHAEPVAFTLGLLTLGLALLVTGSDVGHILRRVVSAPILRFSHHATLLAEGAFLVLAVRQICAEGLSKKVVSQILFVSFVLVLIAALSYGANLYINSLRVQRLEKKKVYRWPSIAVGLFIVIYSYLSLDNLVAQDAAAAGRAGPTVIAKPASSESASKH